MILGFVFYRLGMILLNGYYHLDTKVKLFILWLFLKRHKLECRARVSGSGLVALPGDEEVCLSSLGGPNPRGMAPGRACRGVGASVSS